MLSTGACEHAGWYFKMVICQALLFCLFIVMTLGLIMVPIHLLSWRITS
jgi:hypothetical protein